MTTVVHISRSRRTRLGLAPLWTMSTRKRIGRLGVSLSLLLPLVLVVSVLAAGFFQGFETDNSGWNVFGGTNDAVRVASGTSGVPSRTGSFHAEAVTGDLEKNDGSAATRWGGYNMSFLPYYTSVDVYLNVAGGFNNDTRFDWDSAASQLDGNFRRDFVFNCGFYNNSDATGSGPRFVISASNNAGRSGAFPENPGRSPFAITQTAWYTFRHYFHAVAGVMVVDFSILDSNGNILHAWQLSDPSDTTGICCGNRYGWFPLQEFSFLAFDNSQRVDCAPAPPLVFDVCLQDDRTGDFLKWNATTGDYRYIRCGTSGFTITGTGSVRVVNSIQTLIVNTPGRRISAGFLMGQRTGSATLLLNVAPGVYQTFRINSTSPHPTCTCPL